MLQGNFRVDSNNDLVGWAVDTEHPEDEVELQLMIDGRYAGSLRANRFRPDLRSLAPRANVGLLYSSSELRLTGGQVKIALLDIRTGEPLPPGSIVHHTLKKSVGAKWSLCEGADAGLVISDTVHGNMILNKRDMGVDRELLLYGEYAMSEIDILRRFAPKGLVMVDVGANIGAVTLSMAQHAEPSTLIYAFEPQPNVYLRLCGNLALNGIDNVRPLNCAILDRESTVVVPYTDYSRSHVSGGQKMMLSGQGYVVPCYSLDNILDKMSAVGFIKIDVEGHEREVFSGSKKLIERCSPVIYFESRIRSTCLEIFEFLMQQGYKVFWHPAPLFRENNYYKSKSDHYHGSGINSNILAVRENIPDSTEFGLVELGDAREFWPKERFPQSWQEKIAEWEND